MAKTNVSIAKHSDLVKISVSKVTKPGVIRINPTQAAERLPHIPESTRKTDLLTKLF
jgi:hypothetical protein